MPTTAPVPQKTFTLAPAGTHVARVYRFMNLGTRFQEFQGKTKDYPDTLITFTLELPNEMNEFEYEDKETGEKKQVSKPFVISREFTLSMGRKSNLRPFVEGIIGTSLSDEEAGNFDIEQLVGMACQATITHTKSKDGERTYANLTSVAPLMKGVEAPAAINAPVIQDVKTMSFDEIKDLPDFVRNKIVVSDEYKERFDPDEIKRKEDLQAEIDKRRGVTGEDTRDVPSDAYSEDEINPEDIPF